MFMLDLVYSGRGSRIPEVSILAGHDRELGAVKQPQQPEQPQQQPKEQPEEQPRRKQEEQHDFPI